MHIKFETPEQTNMFYTDEDIKSAHQFGFWIGAASGAFVTFAILLLIGLYG